MSTPQSVDRDPEQLRQDIERTRHELGDTVAQLAYRADVKAQAREKVDDLKAKVTRKRAAVATTVGDKTPDSARGGAAQAKAAAKQHPVPFAAIGALAAGFVIGRLVARRG
jgi:ElaB/YqjD/DUF883 family membrane-anchored ribosome-binding protein